MGELEDLIAEQAEDMKWGHQVSRPNTVPLLNNGDYKKSPVLRQPLAKNDSRHGTYAGYKAKCRCVKCKSAAAKYKRELIASHQGLQENDPAHGTRNGYKNWNCRCIECKAANAKSQREYQARRKEKRDSSGN